MISMWASLLPELMRLGSQLLAFLAQTMGCLAAALGLLTVLVIRHITHRRQSGYSATAPDSPAPGRTDGPLLDRRGGSGTGIARTAITRTLPVASHPADDGDDPTRRPQ